MLHKHGLEACWLLLATSLLACGGAIASTAAADAGADGAGSAGSMSGSSGGVDGTSGSSGGSGSGSSSGVSGSGSHGGSSSGSSSSVGSSSGGLDDASEESSSGSNIPDGSAGEDDSLVHYDAAPAPPGLAGFAFVINGIVQQPMDCPSDNWEFAQPLNGKANGDSCSFMAPFGCAGVTSVILINTGGVPWAYIASSLWLDTGGYVPGVPTGDPDQLAGVVDAGGQVDITSVYNGGTVAILGSADPFSSPDAGKYASDQGTMPWPAGVAGSEGATQMQLAQIDQRTSCGLPTVEW